MNYPLCFNTQFEPFYSPYQDKLVAVIAQAQKAHSRTLAVRLKLWLSLGSLTERRHGLSADFIDALQTVLASYSREHNTPESQLSYLWTRDERLPCYHAVLFMNQDTFDADTARTHCADSLDQLLSRAWGNVQGFSGLSAASPFCERVNDVYLLDLNHCDYREELNRLVWHISDMARDRARVTNPEARALESSAW